MWFEPLLRFLVLTCMTVAAVMIVRGALVYLRQHGEQSLSECVTWRPWLLSAMPTILTSLLLTQAREVPWDWLDRLALLVIIAPAVLTWIVPLE